MKEVQRPSGYYFFNSAVDGFQHELPHCNLKLKFANWWSVISTFGEYAIANICKYP